ncbi:hypothetical protein MKK70_04830 [Methylobacterium sp. E-041]|uniref:hypothetical protein n=1 Tax=Methylobacterium sp. E-041 TaxID=2836573 RepID=UPI001FB8E870|nr:hypothetical protein [Methylobacterium sp. E-041]MCJ2104711.1 hypothetical protein [Methylobacterium sp. E-041]
MTSQDIEKRLLGLCQATDRYRLPDHRRTAETCLAEFGEIRDQARRLYRNITGSWPRHAGDGGAAPARRPKLPIPSAIHRDQERRRASAQRA